MRKARSLLLSFAVLIGTVGLSSTPAGAVTTAEPEAEQQEQQEQQEQLEQQDQQQDIKERILAIPGMSLVEEKPYTGYRYFVLNYTQPVDHRQPSKGTFKQRITLLHKDTNRPTVFFTSGYNVSTTPRRSEPTQIIDGNQVSMEYRFFTPSRPSPADWSKLDIKQAASDQHRIFTELKKIYSKKWISTGGSKGGMTATYYERFYPRDMDGVVAYVAPNDVVNKEDAAYDRFFRGVGTEECRDALNAVQREALVRRGPLSAKLKEWADANNATFDTVGSLDKAYESTVLDFVWAFWQYSKESDCADVPAADSSDQVIYDYVDAISGFAAYSDGSLATYTPYYYQAGTQLGAPQVKYPHLDGLMKYGPEFFQPRVYVPRDIPMKFDPRVMRDVDGWVRHNATRMLFVNGQNDPWSAEPFRLGKGARDSYVYTAPGANHGANVAGLVPEQKAKATAEILEWAGVAPAAVQADPAKAKPLAKYDAKLDKRDVEQRQTLRP